MPGCGGSCPQSAAHLHWWGAQAALRGAPPPAPPQSRSCVPCLAHYACSSDCKRWNRTTSKDSHCRCQPHSQLQTPIGAQPTAGCRQTPAQEHACSWRCAHFDRPPNCGDMTTTEHLPDAVSVSRARRWRRQLPSPIVPLISPAPPVTIMPAAPNVFISAQPSRCSSAAQ